MNIESVEPTPTTASASLEFDFAQPPGNVDLNIPDDWLKSPEITQGNFVSFPAVKLIVHTVS